MGRREVFRSSLIAAAIASAFGAAFPAAARDQTIVVTGTQAPGLPAGVTFAGFGNPFLNNAGQVAFTAGLAGSGVDATNNGALYRDTTPIVRLGDAAPGLPAGVNFGNFFLPVFNRPFNEAGQVAFEATLTGTGVDTTNEKAIYRNATLVARKGDAAPGLSGVTFASLSATPNINNAGQVLFHSFLAGPSVDFSNDRALYRDATVIVRSGDAAPGLPGAVIAAPFGAWQNNLGNAAFVAQIGGTGVDFTNDKVIYRQSTPVARTGSQAPGLPSGVSLVNFGFVSINDSGQVAFRATLSDPGFAYYRDGTLIARTGDPAPGLAGASILNFGPLEQFNNLGQLAFRADLAGAGVNTANDSAVYRNATLIAREGDQGPGLPAGVNISTIRSFDLNNAGQVAVSTELTGPGVGIGSERAHWIGDGVELVNVVREGMTRNGRLVRFLSQEAEINDFGQVAYWSRAFSTTDHALMLFTPDLRWRQLASGSWDSAANWTLTINPAHVHDVKIDPSLSLTVTGPSTDRTVRTLQIGGGTGIATLALLGGKITALADAVRVFANGVLTGDGTIGSAVMNQGTVRAQNVTIQGGLTNEGVVEGSGRINANISNTTGRISVAAGESLRIGGTVNNSATGNMDVIGGALEITGSFTNAGQLLARDATLRFSGGVTNSGQLGFSFGTSDVFGNITNQSAGKIIVSGASNATFADNLVNQGEVRASSGSRAVYFGAVSGPGSFTGTGTHFFEGTLSPGSSPGSVTVSNAVFGTGSTLAIELGGLLLGTQYDHVDVTGNLVLDGGRLFVSLINGFTPTFGNEFDILDWGTINGTFGTLELPALGSLLAWNTNDLYVDGTISVAAIPEPQTYALLLAGLGLLGFAARRRIRGRSPNLR